MLHIFFPLPTVSIAFWVEHIPVAPMLPVIFPISSIKVSILVETLPITLLHIVLPIPDEFIAHLLIVLDINSVAIFDHLLLVIAFPLISSLLIQYLSFICISIRVWNRNVFMIGRFGLHIRGIYTFVIATTATPHAFTATLLLQSAIWDGILGRLIQIFWLKSAAIPPSSWILMLSHQRRLIAHLFL